MNFTINGSLYSENGSPSDGAIPTVVITTQSQSTLSTPSLRWLWVIACPVILLLGLTGNTLTIVVSRRKSLRRTFLAFPLMALAAMDSMTLITGLPRWWIYYLTEYDIRMSSPIVCQCLAFAQCFFPYASAYLLTVVTAQRFVSVWFPHRAVRMCGIKATLFALVFICVSFTALNLHFLVMPWTTADGYVEWKNNTIYYGCSTTNQEYSSFLVEKWQVVDLTVGFVIPSLTLIISKILITIKLCIRRRDRFQTANKNIKEKRDKKYQRVTSMTLMLIVTGIVFLLLNSPVYLHVLGQAFWYKSKVIDEKDNTLPLLHAISYLLWYLNFAVNFILYCLSGPIFRKELKNMFSKEKAITYTPSRDTTR